MTAALDWHAVLGAADTAGWTARVVAADCLDDVRERVAAAFIAADLPVSTAEHLTQEVAFEVPECLPEARSVVVGAIARPLTLADLSVDGVHHTVVVPPHYAGYHTAPDDLASTIGAALAPAGYATARFEPPLKTLAAGAGLTRYGRNAVTYVPGLGSYLMLAACASDAPPPTDHAWGAPAELERCARCSACMRACPSGAIVAGRRPLQTDRCLTCVNEDEAPFPDWVDPSWHHCAVGCLRCQQACPENATVDLRVSPPEVFDEAESAAVLAATPPSDLTRETRDKLARCGLDYSPTLIARNLRVLMGE